MNLILHGMMVNSVQIYLQRLICVFANVSDLRKALNFWVFFSPIFVVYFGWFYPFDISSLNSTCEYLTTSNMFMLACGESSLNIFKYRPVDNLPIPDFLCHKRKLI